ncbi:MAG: hypothetical protein R2880_02855 [Deinococcales bacterium]
MSQASNEISLRELYLVLRRALPVIFLVGFTLAVIVLVLASLRPESYEAQSITIISPSSIEVKNPSGVIFNPQNNVTFEAYQALAYSSPVIEATLAEVKRQFPDLEMSAEGLRQAISLGQLFGTLKNRPDLATKVPLSISHNVRRRDPVLAAAISNSWSKQSLKTVQEALLGTLYPIDDTTASELDKRQTALTEAETALKDFNSAYNLDLLTSRFNKLTTEIADQEIRLSKANQDILKTETIQTRLLAILQHQDLTMGSANGEFLESQIALAAHERQATRQALETFRQENNIPLLELQVTTLSELLASYQTRLTDIPKELASTEAALADLQSALAQQSERFELQDSILNDSALSRLLADSPLNDASFEREEVNPLYQELQKEIYLLQSTKAGLIKEKAQLEQSLNDETVKLNSLQETLAYVKSQDERLGLELTLYEEHYRLVLNTTQSKFNDNQVFLINLQSEAEALKTQLELNQAKLKEVQAERARLTQELNRLTITAENAKSSYEEVLAVEPTVSYLSQLTPISAQILSEASIPNTPIGAGRALPTLLAFFVGAVLTMLAVLLREAIRES